MEAFDHQQSLPYEKKAGSTPPFINWPTGGGLEFRNVVMRYRPELEPILLSVSFSINSREKIGVVGRTGAGKSSLIVCLLRLIEHSEGSILIDGQDISSLSLTCLRSRISSIPQDPVLFRGTLRYNIDPFSNYSNDEIWQALEKVHMKQKILLLDEAMANIDNATNAMIRQSFDDCTVITIAHRLNTVLHSDKLLVMDAGQVLECASPQALINNRHSHLKKMIAAQS